MDKQLAERLERIEFNLAHLEHLYDQLNQVVLEQGRTLGRMQIQQQRISRTMEVMELDRIKSTNPKPPHHQ
ncbi:MAG TPA: SlyX family protein [Verrucomicrobiae bacterium]|nr:SlyX family protein [Verrucomicrobiae bacterium]